MMSGTYVVDFDTYYPGAQETSVALTLTVSPDGNNDGGYDVTSITGTVGDLSVTGPASNFEDADNEFFPNSSLLVDQKGLSFETSDGTQFDLHSNIDMPPFPASDGITYLVVDSTYGYGDSGVEDISSSPVCYAAGTRILTTKGEVPVELLKVGDHVTTASGTPRPIQWIGHRTLNLARHLNPREAQPIRVRAHAISEAHPHTDLFVSPWHSILVADVLIPVHFLLNGSTIAQMNFPAITYFHIELETHDLLIANGLPAESYLEMGNRKFFASSCLVAFNGLPDAPPKTHEDFCRPCIRKGETLERIHRLLTDRAAHLNQPAETKILEPAQQALAS